MQKIVKQLIGESWYNQLFTYLNSIRFFFTWKELIELRKKFGNKLIPHKEGQLLFKAFRTTPYEKVKVVILGQDPYYDILENGKTRYDGYAFSNSNNTRNNISRSLLNIIKELNKDLGSNKIFTNLEYWAEQGVLLINTSHTVIQGEPGIHSSLWKIFTLKVIGKLNLKQNIVWILWGNHAKNFKSNITNPTHSIIEGVHPAARYGTEFFNKNYFSKCNELLKEKGITSINWIPTISEPMNNEIGKFTVKLNYNYLTGHHND